MVPTDSAAGPDDIPFMGEKMHLNTVSEI